MQSSTDFALMHNFQEQDTHILGASCGHLCDNVTSCLFEVEKLDS